MQSTRPVLVFKANDAKPYYIGIVCTHGTMSTILLSIDYAIFSFLNGWAGRSPVLDSFFSFCAEGIIFFMIAGFAFFILQKRQHIRYVACIEAAASVFIGRIIFASLLHALFFRPRPFVNFSVHQLISISAQSASYPSAHATIMFAMAFSLFFRNRTWGTVYLVLATISSISRVIVGVHYPSDILGGFFVGTAAALCVLAFTTLLPRRRQ